MLRKWEELPTFMQTEEVRPYYEKLSRKWFSLFVKRIFDFAVLSVMLLILSPRPHRPLRSITTPPSR